MENISYPKIVPCSQYKGEHIQYKRNNKAYCRKKVVFKANKTLTDIPENLFKKWGYLFNLIKNEEFSNFVEYDTMKIKIKTLLLKLSYVNYLNLQKVKYVASSLKISLKVKNKKNQLNEIIHRIKIVVKENITNDFIKILSLIYNDNKSVDIDTNMNYIIQVLYRLLAPEEYKLHTELTISNDYYKKLIKEKKENLIDIESDLILKVNLKKKLIHCIHMQQFKNNCLKFAIKINTKFYDPVLLCTSSIFIKRGFKSDITSDILKDIKNKIV